MVCVSALSSLEYRCRCSEQCLRGIILPHLEAVSDASYLKAVFKTDCLGLCILIVEMDYITAVISIANVLAILFTYFLNRRDEYWVGLIKQKNEYIANLETDIASLKSSKSEMAIINNAFAKMFADTKH